MDALSRSYDPRGDAERAWLPFSPGLLSPFLLLFAGGAVATLRGVGLTAIARPLAVAGFHGGLLAGALASAWGRTTGWQGPAWLLTGLLFLAAVATQFVPWGAPAYLLLPLALWRLGARHPQLRRTGWSPPAGFRAWFLGAGVGLFLGAHLLLSASRTLGYPMRLTPAVPLLSAIAYDVGANGLSAELFFRGVIFNFWYRRAGFWAGAVLSTLACLIRYLVDPALPRNVEVVAGALFYVTLLSLTGCTLVAWFGSLFPSLLATCLFFGAYRTLHLW